MDIRDGRWLEAGSLDARTWMRTTFSRISIDSQPPATNDQLLPKREVDRRFGAFGFRSPELRRSHLHGDREVPQAGELFDIHGEIRGPMVIGARAVRMNEAVLASVVAPVLEPPQRAVHADLFA